MTETISHSEMENSPKLKAYYDDKRLFFRNAFVLLSCGGVVAFAQQTAQSLMPLHMANVKLDAQQISLILAISSWIGIPLLLYVSHLTDHWQSKLGRRLPFLAMTFPFLVIMLFVFPYTNTMISCAIVYLIYYAFNSVLYTAYPYLLNDVSKQQYWGRLAGVGGFTGFVAVWLGQVVLMPMVVTRGEKTVFSIAAIFIFCMSMLILFFVKEPPIRSEKPPRFNPIPAVTSVLIFGFSSRRRILICLAFGSIACGINLIMVYVPLQAKVNLGLNEGEIGRYILQFGTITSAVLSVAAGWMIDKMGVIKSMLTGLFFVSLAVLLGFNPVWLSKLIGDVAEISISPVIFLSIAYTLGFMANPFVYLASNVFIMKSVQRTDFATFCACTGSTNLMMISITMILTGWLIKHTGGNYGIIFIVSIIVILSGISLFWYLNSIKQDVGTEGIQT